MKVNKNRLIALDGDGVLLNYHHAYQQAWFKAFGIKLETKNPNAYWAMERFNAPRLDAAQRDILRAAMDYQFWATMPALPGALEACNDLSRLGFELVCVTAVDQQYQAARAENLKALGFDFSAVVATGSGAIEGRSPKANVLASLAPAYFVDDYAPYFSGVDSSVHKALITRETYGSPNVGTLLALADSSHPNLKAFSDWLKSTKD